MFVSRNETQQDHSLALRLISREQLTSLQVYPLSFQKKMVSCKLPVGLCHLLSHAWECSQEDTEATSMPETVLMI